MKWITAGHIKSWANSKRKHCQQTLPELIRRLILAHAGRSIQEFDFPVGDSTAAPGWDGRLKTTIDSPFFPAGGSGWEIGAGESIGRKAEGDYRKRTTDPLGMTRKDTTFVFVTPRAWPQGRKWRNEKLLSPDWKDVRVINADSLEQWLDCTPGVSLWLAREIGVVVSDAIWDLETVWQEWSAGASPEITPELVISGRTKNVGELQKWLNEAPSTLPLQADHPKEAIAFLYAAVNALPETERTQALARCVVVENPNDLRRITQAFQDTSLIIAASGNCIDVAASAVAKGHHVFISMDTSVIDIKGASYLCRPQRSEVEKNLQESGLTESRARLLARDFGCSISVIRRRLSSTNVVRSPAWTSTESVEILLPALLAGAWNEQKSGDCKIIEMLSGMEYSVFIKKLQPLLSVDDPPILKIGHIWKMKAPLDAWFLLAPYITNDALDGFKKAVLTVFTQTDPKYELPDDQQWKAPVYGKSNQHSQWIMVGLAEAMVFLAANGNQSPHISSPQTFVNRMVKEVFTAAQKWETWASLRDITPLLAEAAPSAFIEILEQGIKKTPELFQELMKDGRGVFGECRHSGLLCAIEGILWNPEHFAYAVDILDELAHLDLGGNWSNRPTNSLCDVFMMGYPQANATPEERLSALDRLSTKDPRYAWKILHDSCHRGSFTESYRFRWRDSENTRSGFEPESEENHKKYSIGLLAKYSEIACMKDNWTFATDAFNQMPQQVREDFLNELKGEDFADSSREERVILFTNVRDTLHWVSNYGDKERLKQVSALEDILERLTPEDVIDRVGWLFTPWPQLPYAQKERDEEIKRVQKEAAREILDELELDKILKSAKTMPYPGILGQALGNVVSSEKEDALVLDAMLENASDMPILIQYYVTERIAMNGSEWVENQITRIESNSIHTPEKFALLYLGCPNDQSTWTNLSLHGEKVEKVYWQHVRIYSLSDNDDIQTAVQKLLDANRPTDALQIAGRKDVSISSELLQRLLQELAVMDEAEFRIGTMEQYYLGDVFRQLHERNELSLEEIAKLEWPFAFIFDEFKRQVSVPMALHRMLQKEPSFFVQLVSFTYKRDEGKPDPSSKKISDEHRRIAHEVLHSWRILPGLKDDGTINEKELSDWTKAARKQCEESSLVTGGDIEIGTMLSHSPSGNDGMWPHIAIRNLIEDLNSETIDRHIENGIYNSRGIVSRNLDGGGEQERELVEKHKKISTAMKVGWPRTARVHRSIAESYEHQATREDLELDLRSLR